MFPLVDRDGLKGAAYWQDGFAMNSARLLMDTLNWAVSKGGHALNYMEAVDLTVNENHVTGVRAFDVLSQDFYTFHAPIVVNAAGPWCRIFSERCDRDYRKLFDNKILVWNLLFDRATICNYALAVAPKKPKAHTYFIPPWRGRLIIGTGHVPLGNIQRANPTEKEIVQMIDDINLAIPQLKLSLDQLERVFSGLMPGQPNGQLGKREIIVDHAFHGGPEGLFSVSGVKFTTARRVADRLVCRLFPDRKHNRKVPVISPINHSTPFEEDFLANGTTDWVGNLVQNESVRLLEDLVLRRTSLGDYPNLKKCHLASLSDLLPISHGERDSQVAKLWKFLRHEATDFMATNDRSIQR